MQIDSSLAINLLCGLVFCRQEPIVWLLITRQVRKNSLTQRVRTHLLVNSASCISDSSRKELCSSISDLLFVYIIYSLFQVRKRLRVLVSIRVNSLLRTIHHDEYRQVLRFAFRPPKHLVVSKYLQNPSPSQLQANPLHNNRDTLPRHCRPLPETRFGPQRTMAPMDSAYHRTRGERGARQLRYRQVP